MVMSRRCKFVKSDGEQCRAAPLEGSELCFWHDPSVAPERAEAQRLGGLRRRRETAVSAAYEWGGLSAVEGIRRLLEVAAMDALALENSVARSRTLGYLASLGLKALEVGELEERVTMLEALIRGRR